MKHASFSSRLRIASALLASLTLAACDGSESDLGSTTANADVLVKDAAADDLLSFSAVVESVRLLRENGTMTGELLTDEVRIDLVDLRDTFAWLSAVNIDNDVYEAVVLGFEPFSYEATARDGSTVDIIAVSDRLVAELIEPTPVEGSYRRFEADVNLRDSLRGDVDNGVLTFDPVGNGIGKTGATRASVVSIKGVVLREAPERSQFVFESFVDGDMTTLLGPIEVRVPPEAVLIGETGAFLASTASLFGLLEPGLSQVEVHGEIGQRGIMIAQRVDIEDRFGTGSRVVLEIEGDVIWRGFDAFGLRLRGVRKGRSLLQSLFIENIDIGDIIPVFFDVRTSFLLDDQLGPDGLTSSLVLAAGQRVKVKYSDVTIDPFVAVQVEIREIEAQVRGPVLTQSQGGTSFTMTADATDPVVLAGDVESDQTPIAVDGAGAVTIFDGGSFPELTIRELYPGIRLVQEGILGGPPDAPDLTVSRIGVLPGELRRATVTGTQPEEATFQTSGGFITNPFGGDTTEGPLTVEIEPEAIFRGAAESAEEFFALFEDLTFLEVLEVNVDGIGTFEPNEIRAFEVRLRIVDVD